MGVAMGTPSLRSAGSLAAQRPLKTGEGLGILRDAATALRGIHAAGRVHGAVCAENIVLDEDGVARLCKDALSPPTLSPEQRAGDEPDVRSDVYALGLTVAGLLAGAEPLPEPVERLLAQMTAEGPAERYQSMDEVLMALEACELMTGHRAFRPGQEAQAMRERRRLLVAVVVGLAAVMLVLALLVAFSPTPKAQGEPPESYKQLLDRMAPVPKPKATTK